MSLNYQVTEPNFSWQIYFHQTQTLCKMFTFSDEITSTYGQTLEGILGSKTRLVNMSIMRQIGMDFSTTIPSS